MDASGEKALDCQWPYDHNSGISAVSAMGRTARSSPVFRSSGIAVSPARMPTGPLVREAAGMRLGSADEGSPRAHPGAACLLSADGSAAWAAMGRTAMLGWLGIARRLHSGRAGSPVASLACPHAHWPARGGERQGCGFGGDGGGRDAAWQRR